MDVPEKNPQPTYGHELPCGNYREGSYNFWALPKKVVKILGDAQKEAELQNAGIGRARYFITALPGNA